MGTLHNNVTWNGWFAFIFYWTPLCLCLVGYSIILIRGIRTDRLQRDRRKSYAASNGYPYTSYYPKVLNGTIVKYFLISVIPFLNLVMFFIFLLPLSFYHLYEKVGKWWRTPVIK